VILVAVGTYIHGFDELVAGADAAAARLGVAGFAQIGHSTVVPRHLAWERFLAPAELASRIAAAALVVCHAGIGLVGEAMRAGKPILLMPRRGRLSRSSPAGDQAELARRLAERYPLRVCERPEELPDLMSAMLDAGPHPCQYVLGSDVPLIVAGFLAASLGQSLPASSS
jgi:UDP-N-acetylglucosamine transferase subunit ALG13